jgi:hypothetical protein
VSAGIQQGKVRDTLRRQAQHLQRHPATHRVAGQGKALFRSFVQHLLRHRGE